MEIIAKTIEIMGIMEIKGNNNNGNVHEDKSNDMTIDVKSLKDRKKRKKEKKETEKETEKERKKERKIERRDKKKRGTEREREPREAMIDVRFVSVQRKGGGVLFGQRRKPLTRRRLRRPSLGSSHLDAGGRAACVTLLTERRKPLGS